MFEPDPTWQHFTYGKSFEDFTNAYPPFDFRPEVPSAIREHLEDVHMLLLHSYYRYRFLDIAHARSMQIVEMALYTRHKEMGSPKLPSDRRKKKLRLPLLNELLDWAEEAGLVEDTKDRPSWRKFDQKPIETLRNIRNYAIHAEPESMFGVSAVGLFYRMVDFINELYEDVDVRKRRHQLERDVQQELSDFSANGAILEVGGVRLIVFHAEVLHAELEADGWNMHLGFLKIFPPAQDEQGGYELPDPIYYCASEYEVVQGTIIFKANDGMLARINPITDETNTDKFNTFLAEFFQHPILRPAVFQPLSDQRISLKRYRLSTDLSLLSSKNRCTG